MCKKILVLLLILDWIISVHFHNDFGLATANTLTAIECGANQAHVTVNGMGERTDNCSLEELIVALHAAYEY